MWRFLWCALAGFALSLPASAAEPVILVVDKRLYGFEPLLAGTWMEPLQADGKPAIWHDPQGRSEIDATVVFAGGIPVGVVNDQRRILRVGEIAPVLRGYGGDAVVRERIDAQLRSAFARHGWTVEHLYSAAYADYRAVTSTPARPERQRAFAVEMRDFPMVGLAWDSRRVLVSFTVESFLRSRGKRPVERRQSVRTVHYASAPAPAGVDPVAWWAADGGERIRAEVAHAIDDVMDAALGDAWPEGKPPGRDERVDLHIDGDDARFRGRVWRTDAHGTWLQHHDGSVSILHASS